MTKEIQTKSLDKATKGVLADVMLEAGCKPTKALQTARSTS